jgi:hypothetical protein
MPFPGRKYQRGQKSSATEKTPAHRWGQPGAAAFLQPFRRPGPRWAEICTEFSEKISELGPSPVWLALKKKKDSSQTQEKQPV